MSASNSSALSSPTISPSSRRPWKSLLQEAPPNSSSAAAPRTEQQVLERHLIPRPRRTTKTPHRKSGLPVYIREMFLYRQIAWPAIAAEAACGTNSLSHAGVPDAPPRARTRGPPARARWSGVGGLVRGSITGENFSGSTRAGGSTERGEAWGAPADKVSVLARASFQSSSATR